MKPRATYRVQLSREFDFNRAAALVPYLADLGISHLYASPWLTARPGSAHHYDVIDYSRIDEQLGGEAGFARLHEALQAHGMGHIVDFVPNHMGVGFADNRLWLNVLEWGPESEYARWFDIDWESGKLLVPLLGQQYGVELERGTFELRFDPTEGSFSIWAYGTHRLPVCPRTYPLILGTDTEQLERLSDAFAHLSSPAEAAALQAELKDANPPTDVDLAALIERQHWRPAHFRVASDDINYRRFFNINELAAVRMESPEVFESAHRLIFDLLKADMLQGLRIDHVDGLLHPRAYLERLPKGPYVVAEKILAPHESLREDWPVDGTTGYDFASQVLGVLIDPAAEAGMTQVYGEITGDQRSFAEVLLASKLHIIRNEMAGELQVLAKSAAAVARQNPCTQDFTQNVFGRALEAIVANFPVYRTYVDERGAGDQDRRDLQWAVELARAQVREIDASVFGFLFALLTGDLVAAPRSGYSRTEVLHCAMRFQQYTGPVMAKGLEDTAIYRYPRLLALNEVGSRPDQFGLSVAAFHRSNEMRLRHWPSSMLTTSTHDTKFGEDVRARLAVLAEMPGEWGRQISAWSRILRAPIGGLEGDAPPSREDEYLLYQLLVGTWQDPSDEYIARIQGAMLKAMREAKLRTSWIAPDESYEASVRQFVDRLFRTTGFLSQFTGWQEHIAGCGRENSLAMTVLKLTCPGVPDFYQGAEGETFALMDPDNRRPVDFEQAARTEKAGLVRTVLRFRRDHEELFRSGSYRGITAGGEWADRVIAFERSLDTDRILVACARFPHRRTERGGWGDTALQDCDEGEWRDLLTGESRGPLRADTLFRRFPAVVLHRRGNEHPRREPVWGTPGV